MLSLFDVLRLFDSLENYERHLYLKKNKEGTHHELHTEEIICFKSSDF